MHGWRDVDGAEIVAICDRDPERLRLVGDQFGIERRYADAAEMFADGAARLRRHRHHRRQPPGAGRAGRRAQACRRSARSRSRRRWPTPRPWSRPADDAGRAADGARELPLAVADPGGARRCSTPARSASRSGAASRSAPASTSSPASPISPTGERFIIEDLGIHILDIARFLFGDVTTLTARTAAGQPDDQRRGRGDHAARPRERRHLGRRLQLRDAACRRSRSPRRWSRSTAPRAPSGSAQGYRLTVHRPAAAPRSTRRLPAAAALGVAALAQHPGERRGIQQHWVDCLRAGREPRPPAPTI